MADAHSVGALPLGVARADGPDSVRALLRLAAARGERYHALGRTNDLPAAALVA